MKKVFTSALIASLLVSAAWAGGPANKATGDITTYDSFSGNCADGYQFRQMDFNAHEGKDGRPAKGFFTETVLCPDGSTARYFEATVVDVCVNDDGTADFLILFTYDSNSGGIEGRYDQMTVVDNGEPGDLDGIYRRVLGDSDGIPAAYNCDTAPATNFVGDAYFGGNIQVHYR